MPPIKDMMYYHAVAIDLMTDAVRAYHQAPGSKPLKTVIDKMQQWLEEGGLFEPEWLTNDMGAHHRVIEY